MFLMFSVLKLQVQSRVTGREQRDLDALTNFIRLLDKLSFKRNRMSLGFCSFRGGVFHMDIYLNAYTYTAEW